MANIILPVFHSVTDDLEFFGCIHHSLAYVVVEGRAYSVSIATAEVPGLLCVWFVVYEIPAPRRTNWGGILVKRAIEVLPG